jgi:FtsP/CotA-like multicopper oxidase with cupredoxin domain
MSDAHATTFPTQAAFASGQPHEGSPVTEFRRTPDRVFLRKFFNRRLRFPDGAEHEIWGFEDEKSGRGLPSPLVRVTEGQVMHGILKPSKKVHTIHWHGIEPDPRNDGVGHTSFEVTGEYTYQWIAEPGIPGDPNAGAAGSYFYHCHVNTVLHVQMGMFGNVIIDPVVHPDFPVPAGARRPFVDGPLYDIATETLLVPYSVDPRWHQLSHAAGLSGEDVGLNRFEPKHFYVLGGNLSQPFTGGGVHSLEAVRANAVGHGFPTLLRILNGNYFPTQVRFTDAQDNPVRIAEVLSHDGRIFRDTSSPTGPSRPVRDVGNKLETAVLAFGAAERYDMLVCPAKAGEYRIHVDLIQWVTGQVLFTQVIPLIAI